MPRRFKQLVAYDGTEYGGWQVQPGVITVQEVIEGVLKQLTQESIRIHPSGRTDAGVHANGQVIHFDADSAIPMEALQKGMNALLPAEIRVREIVETDPEFHARFSAKSKEYRYHIYNGSVVPPFVQPYRCHERRPLDRAAMQAIARVLEGEHDFGGFAANPNREVESSVRTIYALEIAGEAEDLMIRVHGNGFLYKMVRGLAGFLIEAGLGKRTVEDAHRILASGVRDNDVPTAPAKGLFLWEVFYEISP
ncbi:MAG: tRNA pseudouridine38-40 synthase [Kiritimatiellia bacterium]|jgi:tRNA pseudouridine38-40 synthase